MADNNLVSSIKKLSFSRTILPILAIAAIIIAIYLVATGQPDRSQDEATIAPPKASSAFADTPSVAGSGVVEPSSEIINIGTSIAGLVRRIYVSPGQQVQQGDALFSVDDREIRTQITEANAAIAQAISNRTVANAALITAQEQLSLFNAISDSRAVSRAEIIAAQGAVRNARAQISQANAQRGAAQAALASARSDLERLTVRAPISAQILSIAIRPGEFVSLNGPVGSANDAYMQIGNTLPLHVRIDIDENEISRVDRNSEAIISPRGNSDKRVKATLVRAEPLVTPKRSLTNSASERVDVRVLQLIYQLPLSDNEFFVGQQVDAFVRARSGGNDSANKPTSPEPNGNPS